MCQINMLRTICVLTLVSWVRGEEQLGTKTPRPLIKNCVNGIFSVYCLKFGVLNLIEKLNSKEEVRLFPGVSIVKEFNATDGDDVTSILKSSENNEERVDKILFYKLGNYLDSHSMRLKMADDFPETARTIDDGMKGGKKDGMAEMMAMAALMKGDIVSIAIGGLALITGKALATALLSLLMSAILGIKATSGGEQNTIHEVVAKPIYSDSYSHDDVGSYHRTG